MKRKGILLFAVLIFVLMATSAWANENSGVQAFPIDDSVHQAEHLMVGMFGYSQEEAKLMRYEANTEYGSNATDVQVYPLANSDDHFDLSYLWDGSLIEWKTTVPSSYSPSAQTISLAEACQQAYHLMIGLY